MNKKYLDLMEKTLSAYTDEHIIRYFNDVKKNGLKEQGFPRLTSNIGILIANGRRHDLAALFREMMEFCCRTIPVVKASNDFSVREIVSCMIELEKNNAADIDDLRRWKGYFATIEPKKCYSRFAEKPTDPVRNWALFTAVSEYFRQSIGLCDSSEFIDIQIASQLQWIDENGMYMDNAESDVNQPIMYDHVPRGLFALLLHAGYRGKYYEKIDSILKKAGLLTLNMQSAIGEMAFGGRSNQFVHNEAWLSAIFEYEATRYKNDGNEVLARKFKAAAVQSLKVAELWLGKHPISHVKNRFPTETKFGCETYAYFDKYMITASSYFYVASLFCDDSILPEEFVEAPMIWSTSKYFHKTFVKALNYSLEFDTDADPHYDGSGLGRIHKKGAPGPICLSVPFAKSPDYYSGKMVNSKELSMCVAGKQVNSSQFSICPAVKGFDGEWHYGADSQTQYHLIKSKSEDEKCEILFKCVFDNGAESDFFCSVDKEGIFLETSSDESREIGIALPVFDFDGKTHTKLCFRDDKIYVEYDGWICEYSAQSILDLQTDFANRNGFYKGYISSGKGKASVRINIYPIQ